MPPFAGAATGAGAGSVAEKSSFAFFLPSPRNCALAGVVPNASAATTSAPVARPVRNFMAAASDVLIDIFEHLVGRRDHLRIDLVRALRLDHVDQFLDDIHVRSLECALSDL